MRDVRPGSVRDWRRVAVAAAVALIAAALVPATQASGSDRVTARTAADGANGSFTFLDGPLAVRALAFFDDSLIASGDFSDDTSLDDSAVMGLSGGAWSPLGAGLESRLDGLVAGVLALAVQDDTLIAAGNFKGAVQASGTGLIAGTAGIAAFAGGRWHSMGSPLGTTPVFYTLAVMDDTLYAGGQLDNGLAGPAGAAIAQWGDDTWSPLGAGLNVGAGTNIVLAAGDDTLYAGSPTLIGEAGGVTTGRLAAWSDDTWHALSPGVDDSTIIKSMVVQDDTLYVGGTLHLPGGTPSSMTHIAARINNSWRALGSGVNARVTALAVDDTHGLVYAGGVFSNPRNADDTLIAQAFDTATGEWIALDDDTTTSPFQFNGGETSSFLVDDSEVYIGMAGVEGFPSGGSVVRWTWESPTATLATSSGLAGSAVDITGWSLIGVDEVTFGSTSASISRDDSTSLTATVPNLDPGTYTVTVSAVGGTTTAGNYTVNAPPPPPPAPGAPTGVTATAGDASATATWQAPADPGAYPVTRYQVEATPSGRGCITSTTSCEVIGLTNGTSYTFRVRALSGAGWGAWSMRSNAVTPQAPPTPTIVITGTRDGRTVKVTGSTTGFGMGGLVTPHTRTSRGGEYSSRKQVLVDIAGSFRWSRTVAKSKTLWVYFTGGGVKSNVVRLARRT